MTRRQQLILFVLGLATVSTCTVAFAMAMSMGRRMAIAAPADDGPVVAEARAGEVAWQVPPTLASPSGPASQPASAASAGLGEPAGVPQIVAPPTHTPLPTPTNTRVPTWTPSPTYTPTATRVPTDTPVPTPTHTPPPAPASASVSAPATSTPTPAHEFPFDAMLRVSDTGTPQITRVTGMVWKIVDVNMAMYTGEPGYRMRLVDPHGRVHMSDVSGTGGTDSTCYDCGDNQKMNMKVEFPPYVPGTYRVTLMWEEKQMSPEVEFTLAVNPLQYVHVHFVPLE